MTYCRHCGAPLEEGTRFCPACGAAAAQEKEPAPQLKRRGKRNSPRRRWWLWVLLALVIAGALGRAGGRRTAPAASQTPAPTSTAKPPPTPPSPAPTAAPEDAAAENEIRPDVREFLDSYEAFMDEYIDFMQRYLAADATEILAMMGDYTNILSRYGQFAEAIDAMDESELTDAELACYLEVTGRVNRKLMSVAGQ